MEEASEEHLDALRDEFRNAGNNTLSVKLGLGIGAAGIVTLAAGLSGATEFVLPAIVAGCTAFSVATGVLFHRRYRAALRRRLDALSPEQQEAVLAPLANDAQSDTRRIAAPLLRELRHSREVTPAPAPAGGGKEVSPENGTAASTGGPDDDR